MHFISNYLSMRRRNTKTKTRMKFVIVKRSNQSHTDVLSSAFIALTTFILRNKTKPHFLVLNETMRERRLKWLDSEHVLRIGDSRVSALNKSRIGSEFGQQRRQWRKFINSIRRDLKESAETGASLISADEHGISFWLSIRDFDIG